MNIEESKILLTYSLGGRYLVSPGKYESARVSKTAKGYVTDKPLKVIKEPEYSDCTRTIILGNEFIKHALERPKSPKKGFQRWLRSNQGKLYQNWNKLSVEQRLRLAVENYAQDMVNSDDVSITCELI